VSHGIIHNAEKTVECGNLYANRLSSGRAVPKAPGSTKGKAAGSRTSLAALLWVKEKPRATPRTRGAWTAT